MAFQQDDSHMTLARIAMVESQVQARGVSDLRVLDAMRTVPRHCFVPEGMLPQAHADHPLPIGQGQTLSQPYIVAYMAEALALHGHERVLEVGSGSGYMAAVLSLLALEVFALELESALYEGSQQLLAEMGYGNVHLRCGDGSIGWPEQAPFDAILLSCAAPKVPAALWEQLAEGGCLLLPLGPAEGSQRLVLIRKQNRKPISRVLLPVVFVPLR